MCTAVSARKGLGNPYYFCFIHGLHLLQVGAVCWGSAPRTHLLQARELGESVALESPFLQ